MKEEMVILQNYLYWLLMCLIIINIKWKNNKLRVMHILLIIATLILEQIISLNVTLILELKE